MDQKLKPCLDKKVKATTQELGLWGFPAVSLHDTTLCWTFSTVCNVFCQLILCLSCDNKYNNEVTGLDYKTNLLEGLRGSLLLCHFPY